MAPSLVETETLPVRSATSTLKAKVSEGFNKEFVGLSNNYDPNNELKGSEKHAPASFPHYLPVWDNETEKSVAILLRQSFSLLLWLCC
jgi:sulfonate dioxygenase